jgi:hypothetical protein
MPSKGNGIDSSLMADTARISRPHKRRRSYPPIIAEAQSLYIAVVCVKMVDIKKARQ